MGLASRTFAVLFVAYSPVLTGGEARAQHADAQSPPAPESVATVRSPVSPKLAASLSAGTCCLLPSGFVVHLQLVTPVGSKDAKPGDAFALVLAAPIVVDGRVLVPAGATGAGEVIDAKRAGFGGKPGKLVLAARYLDYAGVRIALRAMTLGGSGQNNTDASFALGVATGFLPGMIVQGGDLVYSAGTSAMAKIRADIILPPPPTLPSESPAK